MAKAISGNNGLLLPYGEVLWVDPRTEYRMAALNEGKAMLELGIPLEFISKTLGFTKDEREEMLRMAEEERERKLAEQQRQFEQQAALRSSESGNSGDNSNQSNSGSENE